MNIGTQLTAMGTTIGPLTFYSPWFPKGADNAYFSYELLYKNLGTGGTPGSFIVTVYTKNREDFGSEGTAYTSFTAIGSSTTFFHKECTNLKQLIRFKFVLTPGLTPPTVGQDSVIYRILPPTWYDTAV